MYEVDDMGSQGMEEKASNARVAHPDVQFRGRICLGVSVFAIGLAWVMFVGSRLFR